LLFMSGGPTAAFHLAMHHNDLVDASLVDPGRVSLVLQGKASPHAKYVSEDFQEAVFAKYVSEDFQEAVFEAELALNESSDGDEAAPVADTEQPCFDAVVGDHCREALEWSKAVGINKHPDWYPNLTAESSLREVQWSLWLRSKAGCREPCPEPTTTTATTTTLPRMNVEDMSVDQLQKFINKEWDGRISKDASDERIPDGDATENASREVQADQASNAVHKAESTAEAWLASENDSQESNATGNMPATGDAAQAPESTAQDGDGKNESQVAIDVPTTGDAAQTQEAPQEGTEQERAGQEDNMTIVSEDSWEKKGDEVIGGEPALPGCYMRLPSGCPNHHKKSTSWRHDLHAEQMVVDDAQCQERKVFWDDYCGSTDTRIMFVPQTDGLGAEVIGDDPTLPGCYMRLPSACPNHHKKSTLWRHDLHA